MKITTLTADELELQDSGTAGVVIGIVLAVAGLAVGIFLRERVPYALWIGIAMIAAGIAVTLFSSTIIVNASRRTGQLRYQKKRIVASSDSLHAIENVFRIETRKTWRMRDRSSSGDQTGQQRQEPVLVAQSFIVFKDGKVLALDKEQTSSTVSVGSLAMMSGQAKESAMAYQVAQFLNVPFQEIMPPNMGSGINFNITQG